MVGPQNSDDAAVYLLSDDTALIQTLDFFTPIVDDPYTFGQIAAANALSDIYAMGGTPLIALNIVCFPTTLSFDILKNILQGGSQKVLEAQALVAGGHSVDDKEPKYGLSVAGIIHPAKLWKNHGCKVGDILILTKPLGTGIINTAIKGELASDTAYIKAVEVMKTLNKYAAEIITDFKITACTDVTGFGLMGHAYEMAAASQVTLRIFANNIPILEKARDYAEMGLIPAGTYKNKEYLQDKYVQKNIPMWLEDIIFDPQTSGGLLFSCDKDIGKSILQKLNTLDLPSAVVGEVLPFEKKYLLVE